MTAPFQYQNEDLRPQSPDSDLVLMLHDHMQVFTSTVGTQTDPEIFYVNGKPARAVQPFRIIPKPDTAQTVVVQTEEDEDEEAQTEDDIQEQPHTSGWQQARWTTSEQDSEEQGIVVQGEVEVESEQGQEDGQEEEVQEPESPESDMEEPAQQELQSQETQTELQHLQRQLLLLKEEDQATAEAN